MKSMKPILLLITLLGSIVLLSACEQSLFGMPQSEFNQLNAQQKQQVITAYNQREQIRVENEPYEALLGAVGTAIHVHKDIPISEHSSKTCHSGNGHVDCRESHSSSSFHVGF